MLQVSRAYLVVIAVLVAAVFLPSNASPQTPPASSSGTAMLREVRCDGLKSLGEAQVAALSELKTGSQVGRDDLQAAADKLLATGLFANVKYNFQSRVDGLLITFHLQEAERSPAYFDNLPWFSDSELNDAIRNKLPFYDGTLPNAGSVVDQAAVLAGEKHYQSELLESELEPESDAPESYEDESEPES